MREYLFRGKRLDNNNWVYGSLVSFGENSGDIMELHCGDHTESDRDGVYVTPEEIDMKTVGQYTGLTDKNGTKIFEGDILARYSKYFEKWIVEGVVKYGEFNCSCCDGVYGWIVKNGDIRDVEYLRVAGNIHDNPELLGGETDD